MQDRSSSAPSATDQQIGANQQIGDCVERPWGSYTILDCGDGYQVKRLIVKAGERLSLQSHRHRSEHWYLVSGVADVTLDATERRLIAGESVDIGIGVRHRLGNSGDIAVIVIEVQRGDYLGEDDIIRYADIYGRDGSERDR